MIRILLWWAWWLYTCQHCGLFSDRPVSLPETMTNKKKNKTRGQPRTRRRKKELIFTVAPPGQLRWVGRGVCVCVWRVGEWGVKGVTVYIKTVATVDGTLQAWNLQEHLLLFTAASQVTRCCSVWILTHLMLSFQCMPGVNTDLLVSFFFWGGIFLEMLFSVLLVLAIGLVPADSKPTGRLQLFFCFISSFQWCITGNFQVMHASTLCRISGQPSSSALFRGCKETGGWCLPVLQSGVSSPLQLFPCNSWPHFNCFYLKWSWHLSRRT